MEKIVKDFNAVVKLNAEEAKGICKLGKGSELGLNASVWIIQPMPRSLIGWLRTQ